MNNKELLEKTHDTVIELKTILVGMPDSEDKGLVGELKDLKTDVKELNCRHRRLSRNFWILIGILAGSGVLGSGLWGLLN